MLFPLMDSGITGIGLYVVVNICTCRCMGLNSYTCNYKQKSHLPIHACRPFSQYCTESVCLQGHTCGNYTHPVLVNGYPRYTRLICSPSGYMQNVCILPITSTKRSLHGNYSLWTYFIVVVLPVMHAHI